MWTQLGLHFAAAAVEPAIVKNGINLKSSLLFILFTLI